MPFVKDGVPALQASPRLMVGWFCAYVKAKCLKTSSSGVSEGDDAKLWNTNIKNIHFHGKVLKLKLKIILRIEVKRNFHKYDFLLNFLK